MKKKKIMRNLKYVIAGCLLVLGSTSCKKWLNVNTDPDHPNNSTVLVQDRLPWIQHFYCYTAGVTNYRTACQAGVFYSATAAANAFGVTWTANTGNITPYQTWFVEVASNLNDLYTSAQAKGAYSYAAAADVFSAMGFMEMLDLYGEMPYTQAVSGIPSPTYDNGKTIYNGCMAKLNEAISLFGKAQSSTAPSFALGDMWLSGSTAQWIKFCYGLKARYMLKLSKKSDLYNADSILYCLSQGPQSVADDVIQPGFNNSTVTDYLEGDPVVTNGIYDYAGESTNNHISAFYYNLLTNMRGAGVTDPRMPKIVPSSMANVQLNASGQVQSNTWLRGIGVDFYGPSTRLLAGGPTSIVGPSFAATATNITYTISNGTALANFIAAQTAAGHTFTTTGSTVTVTYPAGSIFINSTNYLYAGDTVYTNIRASSLAFSGIPTQPATNVSYYPSTAAFNAGVVGSTGSFQTRPVSNQEILTYHEMCFIKAEVEMRKGDPADAYTAYLAGIQAHMTMMQNTLSAWQAEGYATSNPDMAPMNQSDINTYLASPAVVQGAGALTMSDIMLQKYIAMGCSLETYNDMRRFDFSAGDVGSFGVVYPGYQRGPLFAGSSLYTGSSPTDPRYWQRRWALPTTLELNYNLTNALAINPNATAPNIWSMPVWWDCATDAIYNQYLQ
jgi:Starch-binding associating with outer membrane